MQTDTLSDLDKKILKSNLNRISLIYVLVGLIVALIIGVIHFIVLRIDLSKFILTGDALFWTIFTIAVIVYLILAYKGIRPSYLDIKRGEKIVKLVVLKEKKDSNSYGYHANTLVDFKNTPVLTEYYLIFEDLELLVEKDEYNRFSEGDEIKISISQFTSKIIQMQKV